MKLLLPDSNITVELKDKLAWGESEDIEAETFPCFQGEEVDFIRLRKSKYMLLGIAIKSITTPEGQEVKFTKEWMDGLSMDDGHKLYIAGLALRKKKSTSSISSLSSPASDPPQK